MTDALAELEGLVLRLADGDRLAFRPAFAVMWPVVHRFCGRLLGSGADAEDAAQQALEKIFARTSGFDRSRPALPWVLGIAAWECRTFRRRRQRAREGALPEHDTSASRERSPEEAVIEGQLKAAARSVLGQLSELDQETLCAAFEDERPEIAAATFRKRRERAMDRIRAAWRNLYGSL
jgi:RNA polymerase sigma-70 factor (ECF subfamily)